MQHIVKTDKQSILLCGDHKGTIPGDRSEHYNWILHPQLRQAEPPGSKRTHQETPSLPSLWSNPAQPTKTPRQLGDYQAIEETYTCPKRTSLGPSVHERRASSLQLRHGTLRLSITLIRIMKFKCDSRSGVELLSLSRQN
uniref:Uncharacterized protein n=1 Tax=Timema cristinae TaxID=61476 RepID=A0A7R9CT81_TIMCR|nr:unnamed protein product [Timema cristinae]